MINRQSQTNNPPKEHESPDQVEDLNIGFESDGEEEASPYKKETLSRKKNAESIFNLEDGPEIEVMGMRTPFGEDLLLGDSAQQPSVFEEDSAPKKSEPEPETMANEFIHDYVREIKQLQHQKSEDVIDKLRGN